MIMIVSPALLSITSRQYNSIRVGSVGFLSLALSTLFLRAGFPSRPTTRCMYRSTRSMHILSTKATAYILILIISKSA